jgi:N-acetylglucosamine-6-sulfatase
MKHWFFTFLMLTIVNLIGQNANLKLPAIPKAKPKNVIFILSDDHRYDYMSFMKNNVPYLKTPNLDKMRAEGAHLQNAFVTTALCSPSRASILTGLFTHQHTIVDNIAPEPSDLTYFPQYIKAAGYATGFFGKWHMGNDNAQPRKGFDKWVSFRGQGVYYNPTLNIDGKDVKYGSDIYTPTLITDLAQEWLTKRDKKKPFFMYLSHKSIHAEFRPAKRDSGIYQKEVINYPPSFALTDPKNPDSKNFKDVPKWVQRQRNSWHGVDYAYHGEFNLEEIIRNYCETLHSLDKEIGRVFDYLKANGLDENTLVIYMGDNGFMFGEHGLIDKRVSYEESIRVPMLARCPGTIQPSTTITKMVQNVDVAPTVLEAMGLTTPATMVGKSLMPLLKGELVQAWRDKVFYEYYWEHDFPHTPTQFAVRTDKYKYIRYHGIWDTNEFYDLEADPHEMNNLIREPKHQDRIKGMVVSIYDWLESTKGMNIPLKRLVKFRSGDHENPKVH